MANTKISAFTAASALTGSEELGGVQSAANAKITPAQIKTYCNTQGFVLGAPFYYPNVPTTVLSNGSTGAANVSTLNAAGQKVAFMGQLYIPNVANGTSKTLSAAGSGKIAFRTGTVTWANAGTSLDIGIQGISTAAGPVARPDDTFSVKTTAVPGSLAIATGENIITMTSGSVSLTNGGLFAVVFDMTARAGADAVPISSHYGGGTIYPCTQLYAAAAWGTSATSGVPIARIEFDDGTIGYFQNAVSITACTAETWADATNPDERGNIMRIPFKCTVSGIWLCGGVTDNNSGFTGNIYSDPTGTPALVTNATSTYSARQNPGVTGQERGIYLPFSADVTLEKNTDYFVGIRATGTTNARLLSWTVNASTSKTWFGDGTAGKSTRDGGSGAFAAKSATVGYYIGVIVNKIITG